MATAQDIIDRARHLINDEESDFASSSAWSDTELLDWINDAQRQIVSLKPEANATTDHFTVESGRPRQRLNSSDATKLIRVEANSDVSIGTFTFRAGVTSVFGLQYRGVVGDYGSPFVTPVGEFLTDSTSLDLFSFYITANGTLLLEIVQEDAESHVVSISFVDQSGETISLSEPQFQINTVLGDSHGNYSWLSQPIWPFINGATYSVEVVYR